jgi:hypothetical protein
MVEAQEGDVSVIDDPDTYGMVTVTAAESTDALYPWQW